MLSDETAPAARGRVPVRDPDEPALELAIPLGLHAPAVARAFIADRVAGQVESTVLETALLLVSELVSNSVRHSGMPEGEPVIVRVQVHGEGCLLEVEDPGHDGVIAPQPGDLVIDAGVGLNLVEMLSERWGVVRTQAGPTRVWVQLPRASSALIH